MCVCCVLFVLMKLKKAGGFKLGYANVLVLRYDIIHINEICFNKMNKKHIYSI